MPIPIIKPTIGDEEIEAVATVLRSGWITQGPEVASFEREFAHYVGAEFACAVSSCTAALHLALLAVGVKPGDEVITVSHSFIATANAIRYCGATPVFIDIDRKTFNANPDLLEAVITERTAAILCVHQMGMPCDLEAMIDVAKRHNLPLVEDAACAVGSEIQHEGAWQKIGRPYGDIACFSFHPRKILTTGDGGMIMSSRRELDERVRQLRQHCMTVADSVRHEAKEVIFESYPDLGFNYRMTDIQAAVGRVQLKDLDKVVQRRRRLAARYSELLSGCPSVTPPHEPEWARSNWQSLCVRLADGIHQRHVMQRLLDAGVSTRRGIMCAHREPAYSPKSWSCGTAHACECLPGTCERLTESEVAQEHCLILPLFHTMTDIEQDKVVSELCSACDSRIPSHAD